MKGIDLLSIIFLLFVCIVLAGLLREIVPNQILAVISSFVIICVLLRVLYKTDENDELNDKLNDESLNYDEASNDESSNDENSAIDLSEIKPHNPPPTKKLTDYNKKLTIQEIHGEMGCSGDTEIYNRMKYLSLQPQLSKVIRASWNARKLQPYLEEELKENENRDWWDCEQEKLDAIM